MNITLRLNYPRTTKLNFTPLMAFFNRIFALLPRLTDVSDEPAALRYASDKYNGEID
jgi:hypothetical protein